jgi:putative ABC transport system permease protein
MLRQIFVVSAINFKSLRQRLWRSLVIVVGMASVIGMLIGGGAWLFYGGKQHLLNNSVFHLSVSAAQIELGLTWAIVVALLGGFLPSIQAARRPVVEALRAT